MRLESSRCGSINSRKCVFPLQQNHDTGTGRVMILLSLLSSFVVCLFCWCRPSTIGGFVVAVVVDALDPQAVRTSTHISQEVLVLIPAFAHRDASTTIIFVAVEVRIVAALSNGYPRPILDRVFSGSTS